MPNVSFVVPGPPLVPTSHVHGDSNAKAVPVGKALDCLGKLCLVAMHPAAIAGNVKVLLTGGGRFCRAGDLPYRESRHLRIESTARTNNVSGRSGINRSSGGFFVEDGTAQVSAASAEPVVSA